MNTPARGGTAEDVWEALWHLANAICREIEATQPQLVVVLHCSGAVVWHAVTGLWRATRKIPLPPTITVHIGQDSASVYWDQYEPNEWEYMGEDRVGHMVAWTARRTAWRTAMARRVEETLGPVRPNRVLMVDDVVADGWTALTAFGVLWAVLPTAQAHLWAGLQGSWREILGRHWFATFHPRVAEQMYQGWETDKAELFPHAWWRNYGFHWPALVSGLVAGGDDELGTSSVSDVFPLAEYLTRYMPEEDWLGFSRWVYATIDAKIGEWMADTAAAPVATSGAGWTPKAHVLTVSELAWTQAWFHRCLISKNASGSRPRLSPA